MVDAEHPFISILEQNPNLLTGENIQSLKSALWEATDAPISAVDLVKMAQPIADATSNVYLQSIFSRLICVTHALNGTDNRDAHQEDQIRYAILQEPANLILKTWGDLTEAKRRIFHIRQHFELIEACWKKYGLERDDKTLIIDVSPLAPYSEKQLTRTTTIFAPGITSLYFASQLLSGSVVVEPNLGKADMPIKQKLEVGLF